MRKSTPSIETVFYKDQKAKTHQGAFMTDDFTEPPLPPIVSKNVEAWIHEMDIHTEELKKALTALAKGLNPAPSTGYADAKKRVEREIKRLTNLTNAMKSGLSRI
jgi:hypothetical protein